VIQRLARGVTKNRKKKKSARQKETKKKNYKKKLVFPCCCERSRQTRRMSAVIVDLLWIGIGQCDRSLMHWNEARRNHSRPPSLSEIGALSTFSLVEWSARASRPRTSLPAREKIIMTSLQVSQCLCCSTNPLATDHRSTICRDLELIRRACGAPPVATTWAVTFRRLLATIGSR